METIMLRKAGLWVDHRQAVVIVLSGQKTETRRIESKSEKQLRRTGDSPLKGPYEAQSVSADDSQEVKLTGSLNNYNDEVITCLTGVDAILLFGPGEARGELQRRLAARNLEKRIVGIETTDKMTENQITAKVKQYVSPFHCHNFIFISVRRFICNHIWPIGQV